MINMNTEGGGGGAGGSHRHINVRVREELRCLICVIYLSIMKLLWRTSNRTATGMRPAFPVTTYQRFFRSMDIDKNTTRNIGKDGQGAEQEEPLTNIAMGVGSSYAQSKAVRA